MATAEFRPDSIRDESADGGAPLSDADKRALDEVEMRRRAATSGKGNPPAAIDRYTGPPKTAPVGMKVAAGPIADTPFTPTPSLDPRHVEAIEGFEDHKGYLATTQTAFSVAFEGLKQIAEGRKQAAKNQAWNDYQQLLQVGGYAEKMHARMAKSFDDAADTLTKGVAHIEKELTTPLENAAVGGFNEEIRGYVRSLPEKERTEFLAAAIRDNDERVIKALLGSPHYLSGLPKSVHDYQLRQYREKSKPELVSRQAVMRAALKLVHERAHLIHSQVEAAMGGKFETLRRVRDASSAAEKALAFESSNNPLE